MTSHPPPSILRLILWPTVLTLIVSIARLVLEVQGTITSQSGGALNPLGISWLALVFGAWFGWRLRRAGSTPLLRPAWVFALIVLAGLVVAVGANFGSIDRGDTSDAAYATLRQAVQTIILVVVPLAVVAVVVWPRLGITLLLYAIPARLTVVALTWLAKDRGWDTHYTKFGPAGIERETGETMFAASVAQLCFWVPYTVIAGTLAGTIAAAVAGRRSPGS